MKVVDIVKPETFSFAEHHRRTMNNRLSKLLSARTDRKVIHITYLPTNSVAYKKNMLDMAVENVKREFGGAH